MFYCKLSSLSFPNRTSSSSLRCILLDTLAYIRSKPLRTIALPSETFNEKITRVSTKGFETDASYMGTRGERR